MTVFHMRDVCQCDEPLIKCDNRGCRCMLCGGLEDVLRTTSERAEVRLPYWMSRSYPYLSIAQHFGLDYGEVLQHADPGSGWPHPEVKGYVEALEAARRLWLYVQRVGMNHALQVLGHATMGGEV